VTEPLRAVFRKPFEAQLAAFRLRLSNLVPTERWDDLRHAAHDRALVVAGALKADLLADFGLALDKAIAEGTGLDAFRRDFRAIVEKHGWHGWTGEGSAKGEAWRAKVIYRTNMLTSRAAGRWAQLVDGGFKYLVYQHSGAAHPRLDHLSWDGLILPFDHPFWKKHYPPNGWGCDCIVRGAHSMKGAMRVGGNPSVKLPADWNKLDAKTGTPPGVGKGWDYLPGESVAQTVALAAQKLHSWPALTGADFGSGLAGVIERAWPIWVADVLAGGSHNPALVGTLSPTLVRKLEALARSPASAEIMVRPGLIRGPKARRHAQKGDALPEDVWLTLPKRLRDPLAVLLDKRTGNLLFYLRDDQASGQIAVVLDYYVRKPEKNVTNMVVSAYVPKLSEVRRRLSAGDLEIVMGSLE